MKLEKKILDNCFLFYLDNIPDTCLDNFFEVTCEMQKNINWLHASVHVENGPHAKNSKKALK